MDERHSYVHLSISVFKQCIILHQFEIQQFPDFFGDRSLLIIFLFFSKCKSVIFHLNYQQAMLSTSTCGLFILSDSIYNVLFNAIHDDLTAHNLEIGICDGDEAIDVR